MTTRRVRADFEAIEEVPEADAAEQRADVVDVTDPTLDDAADVVGLDRRVEPEAVEGPDEDRLVALDEDEYR